MMIRATKSDYASLGGPHLSSLDLGFSLRRCADNLVTDVSGARAESWPSHSMRVRSQYLLGGKKDMRQDFQSGGR